MCVYMLMSVVMYRPCTNYRLQGADCRGGDYLGYLMTCGSGVYAVQVHGHCLMYDFDNHVVVDSDPHEPIPFALTRAQLEKRGYYDMPDVVYHVGTPAPWYVAAHPHIMKIYC